MEGVLPPDILNSLYITSSFRKYFDYKFLFLYIFQITIIWSIFLIRKKTKQNNITFKCVSFNVKVILLSVISLKSPMHNQIS